MKYINFQTGFRPSTTQSDALQTFVRCSACGFVFSVNFKVTDSAWLYPAPHSTNRSILLNTYDSHWHHQTRSSRHSYQLFGLGVVVEASHGEGGLANQFRLNLQTDMVFITKIMEINYKLTDSREAKPF